MALRRIPRPSISSARAVAAASACACLAACAGAPRLAAFGPGGVDPNSRIAAEVTAAGRAPGPYPRFSRVPSLPTDLRPAADWRPAVVEVWTSKRLLDAQVAALTFTLGDSEAWARAERAKIKAADAAPPPVNAQADAEAFAAVERARATPPPAPK